MIRFGFAENWLVDVGKNGFAKGGVGRFWTGRRPIHGSRLVSDRGHADNRFFFAHIPALYHHLAHLRHRGQARVHFKNVEAKGQGDIRRFIDLPGLELQRLLGDIQFIADAPGPANQ